MALTATPVVAFPPTGYDVISTSALVQVYADSGAPSPDQAIVMTGYAVIWRSDPYDGGGGIMTINTRMDTLLLRGYSVVQGDSVFVTLNRDYTSVGQIHQIVPGVDFPAESFFDVYYKITFGSEGDLVKSAQGVGYGFEGRFDYDLKSQQGALETREPATPAVRLKPPLENRIGALPGSDKDRQGGVSLQLTGAGSAGGGGIYAGLPFNIEIWMDNNTSSNVTGLSNGFRIYSPDGATWTVPVTTMHAAFCSFFNMYCGYVEHGVDGINEDTILIGAVAMTTGMPAGWYGMAAKIETGVGASQVNRILCVDSTFVPPAGNWVWGTPQGDFPPEWGGPYCWDIIAQDTCDYIEYAGTPAYYWPIPNLNAIPEYGVRFTPMAGECCTLKTASILVYGPALGGSPGMVVTVYDDDGAGLPGSALASTDIPPSGLPAGLEYVTADFSAFNLVFCGEDFHIGMQLAGDPAFDTVNVVSDDASVGSDRSWAWWQGSYYTILALFGTPYEFNIGVELCCAPGPIVGVNIEPVHMWDEIWQIPPFGRVYQDPRRTPVIDPATGDTLFWVWHKHVVDPPDPGDDTIPTIGLMPVWVGPTPPPIGRPPDETIELTGTAIVHRGPVYVNQNEQQEIQTEIIAMDLTGHSTLFGPTILSLPTPAPGLVTSSGPEFFPAESFFDVFYKVEFPDIGQIVQPTEAPQMHATIEALPPENTQYTTDGVIHSVYDVQNPGVPIGWVEPIHWVRPPPPPPPPPDTIPTIGLMPVIVGPNPPSTGQQPDETIVLYGDAIIHYGDEYDDSTGGQHIVETEMVSMDLTGNSDLFGPAILSLPQPAAGQILTPIGGPDFPAESFFDVFFEVDLPDQGQTIAPAGEPVNMHTTINEIPPLNNKYLTDGWQPIVDVQNPSDIIGWTWPIHWVRPDTCAEQNPGDLNGDGQITASDLAWLVQYVNCVGPPPAVLANADVNGDCIVDQADIDYLQAFLFAGGPPPVDCTCIVPKPPVCICTGWTPGIDTILFSSFQVEIYDPSDTINPLGTAYAFGVNMVVQRGVPYEVAPGIWRMDTDILAFSGNGNSPLLGGPFSVGLNTALPSGGWIQMCDSCNDFWAESFFDINYRIVTSLPPPDNNYYGNAQMELPCSAQWNPFPGGGPFTPPNGSSYVDPRKVPIYNEIGDIVGYVWKVHRVDQEPLGACCNPNTDACRITTALDCQQAGEIYMGDNVPCDPNPCVECTGWTPGLDTLNFSTFAIDLYDATNTTLLGTVYAFGTDMIVQRGAPFEVPPAGSHIMRMNTTIIQFGGTGNDPLLGGPFTLALDPDQSSSGYIQQCDSCDDSWAESHWTIYYVLATSRPYPDDTLRGVAQMDLDCDAGWNPGDPFTPPDGETYNDPRRVPVIDNNGDTVGYTMKEHSVYNNPQEGACCFGTECVVMPGLVCVQQGGVYKGDGVPCDPNPCSCCDPPIRGDIDYQLNGIDISDLVYLVDYMFNQGPPPPCFEEADVNCDGSLDISDLVWIVDYMFTGGPPPCRCDCADCIRGGGTSKIGEEVLLRWSALVDPQATPPYCYR